MSRSSPPGSKPELGDLNKLGQPNFAPGDVLVELDKAEDFSTTLTCVAELGFRQPQLITGIETCQRVRSCVDKIEAEFKAFLDNERDLKGVIEDRIKRYALTTNQRR